MKKCYACMLVIVLMFIILPRTAAAEVSYKFELNFDRQYYFNTWNALTVTVQNPEGPDWQGTVEVERGGRYVKEVFVAEGSAVTVCFYLPPRNLLHTFFQDYDDGLRIYLKDEQQRIVSKSTPVRFNDSTDMSLLMGVLSAEPDKFNRLTSLAPESLVSKSKVIPLKSHHFDHYLFMDNFAMIVVSDTETLQLTPAQQENLARWVESGGLLVVGGGRGWQKNQAAVPRSLLPFIPTGTVETSSLSLLTDQVKLVNSTGIRFLLTAGNVVPSQGHILLEAAEGPLLISGSYGRGQVIYSTLNLEDPPFNNTLNFENIWSYIIGLNRERLFRTAGQPEHWGFSQLVSSLALGNADLVFLSPFKLFSGLLLYILLVGPISYFILKRRQKWEWSWFTVPALAIIFTGTIYAAGSSGRQTELTHYQVNIYDIYQGNQASVVSYSGLFIPRRGSLSLSTDCPVLAAGKGAVLTGGSEPGDTGIQLPNPPLWSIQRLYARDNIALDGPIELTASADQSGGTITVTNRSGVDLFDSYARLGDAWFKTGPLTAGQSKTVSLDRGEHFDFSKILEHYHGGRAMPYPGYSLEELFSGGLLWIGFNDNLQPFRLDGDIKAVPVNIFRVNCELSQFNLASSFNLPEGWFLPQLVGFGGDSQNLDMGRYGYGGYGYERHFYGQGWIDLQFTFPPGIDYQSGSYKLNFSHAGGNGYIDVQVFNHRLQEWQKVGDLRLGGSYSSQFILSDLDQLIAGDRLLVRMSYDGELWFIADRILSVQGGKLK